MCNLRVWIGCLGACLAVSMATATFAKDASGCSDTDTQTGMSMCAASKAKQADAAMTTVYNSLRKRLGAQSPEGTRLRDAQRAWIAYRDAWCAFQSMSVEGGSMYPAVFAGCLEKVTKEQTARLTAQLTCTGDVDCPGSL